MTHPIPMGENNVLQNIDRSPKVLQINADNDSDTTL
jgi:hypothetical protein